MLPALIHTPPPQPAAKIEKRHARARLAAEDGRLGEGQRGRKAEGRCGTQQCNVRSLAEGTLGCATSLLASPTTETFGFHDQFADQFFRKTLPDFLGFTLRFAPQYIDMTQGWVVLFDKHRGRSACTYEGVGWRKRGLP
jgi:hypothetical protein